MPDHFLIHGWHRSLRHYYGTNRHCVNIFRPRQNGGRFTNGIFNLISLCENYLICLFKIPLNFVPSVKLTIYRIVSDNRQQSIVWNYDNLVYPRIFASLGFARLNSAFPQATGRMPELEHNPHPNEHKLKLHTWTTFLKCFCVSYCEHTMVYDWLFCLRYGLWISP